MNRSPASAPTVPSNELSEPSVPAGLLRKALPVVFAAIMVYGAVVAWADFHTLRVEVQQLSLRRVTLALTLVSLSFGVRFLRWRGYLRALQVRLSEWDSALIFLSGLGMSITPGKAGELLKSLQLRQLAGTPIAASIPVVAAERITDAMALLLLGAIGFRANRYGIVLLLLVVVFEVALAFLLGSRAVGRWAIDRATRLRVLARQRERLVTAHESLLHVCKPARLFPALAWALVAWTLHALCLLTIANGFSGVSLPFTTALCIDAAPLLAGAFAMLPGGLGVTDASMVGGLLAYGQGAITPASATAITLAVRIVTLWWAVALGFSALAIWQLRYGRTPESE